MKNYMADQQKRSKIFFYSNIFIPSLIFFDKNICNYNTELMLIIFSLKKYCGISIIYLLLTHYHKGNNENLEKLSLFK